MINDYLVSNLHDINVEEFWLNKMATFFNLPKWWKKINQMSPDYINLIGLGQNLNIPQWQRHLSCTWWGSSNPKPSGRACMLYQSFWTITICNSSLDIWYLLSKLIIKKMWSKQLFLNRSYLLIIRVDMKLVLFVY